MWYREGQEFPGFGTFTQNVSDFGPFPEVLNHPVPVKKVILVRAKEFIGLCTSRVWGKGVPIP